MTSTQLHPSPPLACPDWCQHPDRCSWDQLNETGQLMRGHDICGFPPVGRGDKLGVEVYASSEEYADGSPVRFIVTVDSNNTSLSADDALEVARHLTGAAQRVREIEGRIERVSGGAL